MFNTQHNVKGKYSIFRKKCKNFNKIEKRVH